MLTANQAKEISSNKRQDYKSVINKLITTVIYKDLHRITEKAAQQGLTRASWVCDTTNYKVLKYIPVEHLSTIGRCIVNYLEDLGYTPVYYHLISSTELKVVWHWGGEK